MNPITPSSNASGIDPVSIFVEAVANEMHRDRYIFEKFPVSRHTRFVIPRLEKLAGLAKTFPRGLASLTKISSILWPLLLYPALLILQLASALRHMKWRKRELAGDIFFVTSKTSLLFSKSAGFQGMHLFVSKKLERACPVPNAVGSMAEYITCADLAQACVYALRALRRLSSARHTPGTAFQAYAAFSWFLAWRVLHRNADRLTSLWLSNDCDRWAILLDRLPTRATKIIVQHGLLRDPPGHTGLRNPASLPARLQHIDRVILFDSASEHAYRTIVIAHDCNPKFSCCDAWLIQKNPAPDGGAAASVMLIGQRGHLAQECELANYLAGSLPRSRVYVRPHPGLPSAQYKRRLDHRVLLVDDLYQYPYADLCICFDLSSLGVLYERQGTQVIYLEGPSLNSETKEAIRNRALAISCAARASSSQAPRGERLELSES